MLMDKMKMHTVDITEGNVEKIGQLFPNCLTERVGDDGNVESVIDFDLLRQELSKDIVEGAQERYQFTWPDKKKAIRLANSPTSMALRPCREESVEFDTTENLYIEGDNLEVLKLLREDYLGKVKVIYIDPPYNTGGDFVYTDDFSITLDEYLNNSGQADEFGHHLFQNTESNGRFHTDWLNMVYPRIKVAKSLLSEDGIIFISIDDNEVENLKKVCDEIFGERSFVAEFIWEKRTSRENRKVFSVNHDYIVAYAKNPRCFELTRGSLPYTEEIKKRYSNPDNDPRGVWQSVALSVQGGHGTKTQFYKIITPGGRVVETPSGLCWRFTEAKLKELIDDGRIYFGPDGNNVPRLKVFLSEMEQGITPHTLWKAEEVGTNDSAKKELLNLFEGVSVFETPKPVSLLKRILEIAGKENDYIVLDFFSGSATSAHAVFTLNAEDSGRRRFIMVQLPEETSHDSEAYKAGYKNICEIGKERIRRAGNKILSEQKSHSDAGGLFTSVEEKNSQIDIGFRVLKLDSSNMEDVYYKPEDSSDATLFEDNVKPDRTGEDLLFQVMLECNLPLSAKIKTEKIAGKEVFSVNNGYLIACFDEDVNEKVITEVAKRKPYYFIMRDTSLSSDTVADNFEQIFQAYSKDTIRRIL